MHADADRVTKSALLRSPGGRVVPYVVHEAEVIEAFKEVSTFPVARFEPVVLQSIRPKKRAVVEK